MHQLIHRLKWKLQTPSTWRNPLFASWQTMCHQYDSSEWKCICFKRGTLTAALRYFRIHPEYFSIGRKLANLAFKAEHAKKKFKKKGSGDQNSQHNHFTYAVWLCRSQKTRQTGGKTKTSIKQPSLTTCKNWEGKKEKENHSSTRQCLEQLLVKENCLLCVMKMGSRRIMHEDYQHSECKQLEVDAAGFLKISLTLGRYKQKFFSALMLIK